MRDEYTKQICKDRIEILLGNILQKCNSTVLKVTAELNEILLDPAIRVRQNGITFHKLKCYNYVTWTMRQAYHKTKNRNNN